MRDSLRTYPAMLGAASMLAVVPFLVGCPPTTGNLAEFAAIDVVCNEDDAMVRIYGATIRSIDLVAIHSWLVVKQEGTSGCDRWEVDWVPDAEFEDRWDFLFKNLYFSGAPGSTAHLTQDVGAGETFLIAELFGAEADAVARFVAAESPPYPAKECYYAFPGPNSNTYTQWVLDVTGWDVTLPVYAVGRTAVPFCSLRSQDVITY